METTTAVWCRRTDELVDGPNAARITPEALQRWDDRLEAIFQGKPYDMLDAALSDTVKKFPLSIQVCEALYGGIPLCTRCCYFLSLCPGDGFCSLPLASSRRAVVVTKSVARM
jgi:hypothetical protein